MPGPRSILLICAVFTAATASAYRQPQRSSAEPVRVQRTKPPVPRPIGQGTAKPPAALGANRSQQAATPVPVTTPASVPQGNQTQAKQPDAGQTQSAAEPQQDQQPAVPLRPEQMPAVAPRITYEGGQLTVVAENSTMADIIAGIRNATGIKIETVGGPNGDRVAAKIGPAPARDVLLSLVQGSRYDYVIMGTEQDPMKVDRVILTPRSAAGAGGSSTAAQRPVQPAMPVEVPTEDEDENQGFAPPPVQNGAPVNPQQPPGSAVPANPNETKTPEQIMQELKDMEQQRQQQQQQQQQPGEVTRPPRGERPR